MKKITLAFLVPILSLSFAIGGCSLNQVKVGFDWNIETDQANPKDIRVEPGQPYGNLPSPNFTLRGYDFNGWNTRSDGKGEVITAESIVGAEKKDHVLYGDWQGRQYTVSFDLGGGNINGATQLAPRIVTFGKMYGAMVIPNNPEKKLSTFRGWYLNPEGTGEIITYGSKVNIDQDHTLYAVYKNTRVNYEFESDDELEDFYDNYNSLSYSIEDHKMVITNPSEDPRGHLVLNSPLKAGSVVNFDLQFVGNASAEDEVKAAFYAYGGDENGNKIERGQMGDPTTAKVTRKQIRDWYYGQGANNLTAYDMTEWNDGHILLSMNILEDCSTVVMMMEFGRKAVKDDQGQPTGAFVEDKSLWENNKWVINSIHLNIADYDLVKPEYHFDNEEDIESFVNPRNVNIEVVDEKLKVSKGPEEGTSALELETQYLPKGSKVEYSVKFVGELPTVRNQEDVNAGLTVGIYTHGLYPNGYVMDRRDLDDPAPIESEFDTKWFWGGYCINNNTWDPAMLSNETFTTFTTYILEDCFGINLEFKFGTSVDGYFEIDDVRIVQSVDTYARYNFANEAQLLDFGSPDGLTYTLGEDDEGCYLDVKKGSNGEGNLALKTPLSTGQKVFIDIELKSENMEFSNSSNYFTIILHQAKYCSGLRMSETSIGNPEVLGTRTWDGGWDGSLQTIEVTIPSECFGVSFQLVYGGADVNSSFLIRSIDIQ